MSEKQREFVRIYIETGDAELAYQKAGYARQGAAKATELLNNPAVQRLIAEQKQQQAAEKTGTRPNNDWLGSEREGPLGDGVLADREAGEGGCTECSRGSIAEQDEILAYLTGVLRGTVEDRDKNAAPAIRDRNRAAELLGKRYALFTESVNAQIGQAAHIIDDIPEQPGIPAAGDAE